MLVYNSMLILTFMLMIIYRLQVSNSSLRVEQKIPWGYAIVSMGYIILWAGLRSGFQDTYAYLTSFENKPTGFNEAISYLKDPEGRDTGFTLLMILFKTYISDDFHVWFLFIALASGIPLMLTYRNRSEDYLYSIFLFITSTSVIWMFNGIRQFLAAALLFGFGFLIEKRKLLWFIIIVFICSKIHASAWIVLPTYFFATDKPFGLKMTLFVIVILLMGYFIGVAMETMEQVLEGTQYSKNFEEMEELDDDGVHPLRVLFCSIPVILAFIKRHKIMTLNNGYINLCINMSVIALGLYFIGMLTSGIMIGRLPIYFSLYSYILFPYLFIYVFPRYKNFLYMSITALYLLFYYFMCQHIYYISDILGSYF